MKYAVTFGILAMCLVAIAISLEGAYWLALWPGLSFFGLAAAYAKFGPSVLGKRSNGSLAWWAVLLLLPYFLLTWGLWHLLRLVHREACCNEIVPGLWLGRRALLRDLPPDIDLVVDLTAEFFEPRTVTRRKKYVCLPVLDGSVPEYERFSSLVDTIAAWPGQVYIQCASGHGRSPTLMAAVLIRKGLVSKVDEALQRIKSIRPGIALEKQQIVLLKIWLQQNPAPDSCPKKKACPGAHGSPEA